MRATEFPQRRQSVSFRVTAKNDLLLHSSYFHRFRDVLAHPLYIILEKISRIVIVTREKVKIDLRSPDFDGQIVQSSAISEIHFITAIILPELRPTTSHTLQSTFYVFPVYSWPKMGRIYPDIYTEELERKVIIVHRTDSKIERVDISSDQ